MSNIEDLSRQFSDFMESFRQYQIDNKQVLDAVQARLRRWKTRTLEIE